MQYETIRAAICDDEEFFRNELKKFVSEYGNEMDVNMSIDLYDNAKELMNNILSKSKEYDLLFLDVEMPGMTGIEMADALRKIDPWVCISFVTSYDAFAIQAFRLDALDYVMKPIKYTQVKHIIEKAKIQIDYRKNAQKAEKRYLKIKSGYEDVLIDLQNVIYIEKRRNQCVFHKSDEEICCYEPLKNVYERLDNDVFMYTHQGYIANFNYIKEVKKDKKDISETIQKKAEELLENIGLVLKVEVDRLSDRNYLVNLYGEDNGIIIGKKGKTLNSFEYLLNSITKDYRIEVDVEGFKAKRTETLRELGKKMAEKALKSGKPVRLNPMPPRERKIIHEVVNKYQELDTYSEGRDPKRYIVIKRKK